MPQKAGEIYHIVSMDWYLKWKAFVGFDDEKKLFDQENGLTLGDSGVTPTPGDTAS